MRFGVRVAAVLHAVSKAVFRATRDVAERIGLAITRFGRALWRFYSSVERAFAGLCADLILWVWASRNIVLLIVIGGVLSWLASFRAVWLGVSVGIVYFGLMVWAVWRYFQIDLDNEQDRYEQARLSLAAVLTIAVRVILSAVAAILLFVAFGRGPLSWLPRNLTKWRSQTTKPADIQSQTPVGITTSPAPFLELPGAEVFSETVSVVLDSVVDGHTHASVEAEIAAQFGKGAHVELVGFQNGWYCAELSTGRCGTWINSRDVGLLNRRGSKRWPGEQKDSPEVSAATIENLNIRDGPGTNYETLFVISRGERVWISAHLGGWCRVNSVERAWANCSYLLTGGG